ncbi:polysaccharide biosynthesis protein [Aliivibrio salmonicida]|nr:oligosaccharide flippase family protein [Aliivibrio salmonicida]AZL86075.1 polysaccharide biosynthesis protein [Aliivibrio salmonicida]
MSLLKGARVYLVSNILNAIIPFLLLPILTRYLSPAEYGQIAMFQTLLAGIGTFIGLNAVGAAERKFYDGDVSETVLKEFNGSCMQILAVSSVLVFICIALFQQQLSEFLAIPTSWVLAAVGISILGFISRIRLGQWQIRNQAKLFGMLQVSSSLINMLLSILFVVVLEQGAEGRIDAQVITGLIATMVALAWLYKDNLLQVRLWRPTYIKEVLAFGVPLMPHSIGGVLLNLYDRFVINQQLGIVDVGIYMVAVQLSSAMLIVFDAINKAYVPWLFERLKHNDAQEKQKIVKNTYIYMVSILLLAGLAFWIGPLFITLIAGDKYKAAGEIIGWLCLGQAFSGMYLMVTNYIFFSKKTSYLACITIIAGLINVILLFVFAKQFGLVGVAMAFTLSKLIHFIMTFYISNNAYKMPWGLKIND